MNDSEVLLQWVTVSEVNNAGFEIEQSEDGKGFRKIGFVDGAGNSSSIRNYQFVLKNRADAYYRLKQIDSDGRFEYSRVVFIEGSEGIKFAIFPNPATSFVDFSMPESLKKRSNFQMDFTNSNGIKLIQASGSLEDVKRAINQRISQLPNGVYFIYMYVDPNVYVLKLMKN